MTDEEILQAGKILCKAYYLSCDYSETTANVMAAEVTSTSMSWPKCAKVLADMGHPILGGASTVTGQTITEAALLRQAEQLGENIRVTLEAVEKQPEQKPKAVKQWRFALNCFFGNTHKRGLIPDLKDGGPGAY